MIDDKFRKEVRVTTYSNAGKKKHVDLLHEPTGVRVDAWCAHGGVERRLWVWLYSEVKDYIREMKKEYKSVQLHDLGYIDEQ